MPVFVITLNCPPEPRPYSALKTFWNGKLLHRVGNHLLRRRRNIRIIVVDAVNGEAVCRPRRPPTEPPVPEVPPAAVVVFARYMLKLRTDSEAPVAVGISETARASNVPVS